MNIFRALRRGLEKTRRRTREMAVVLVECLLSCTGRHLNRTRDLVLIGGLVSTTPPIAMWKTEKKLAD